MAKLENAVTQGEDEGWDFTCPVFPLVCGDRATGVPFTSTGWPTKKHALERAREHIGEHLGKGVTSSLEDFRAKHGLTVTDDGKAVLSAEDLT